MAATLKDIARLAGVSAATVSLVLNGRGDISAGTRDRVRQAANDLGYTPRRGRPPAHRLAPGTLRFLKIARHGRTVNRDHNSFLADYIDGLAFEAGTLGYPLEIVSHECLPLASLAPALAGSDLAGLVVLGTELDRDDVDWIRQRTGVPLVFIDTCFDRVDCNFVDMDNRDAVLSILDHFTERGIRRIGCITSDVTTANFALRRRAFLEGMAARALPVADGDILVLDSTLDGAFEGMRARLRAGLDLAEGYFCANDIMSFGVIKAFRERTIRIPDDVSIIGFDNLPMSGAMAPALTTVDVSKRRIGAMAIRLLDEVIRGVASAPIAKHSSTKILVGTDLVIRDSVRPSRDNAVDQGDLARSVQVDLTGHRGRCRSGFRNTG